LMLGSRNSLWTDATRTTSKLSSFFKILSIATRGR
jgi:hypothetical protein